MEEQNKLTVYSNLSKSDSNIDTEELFDKYTKYTKGNEELNKNKNFNNKIIELNFDSNQIVDNNIYKSICKYIKKNYNHISSLLYEKKLIKNKNIPFRILFHIYVNYLNNDMEFIFL